MAQFRNEIFTINGKHQSDFPSSRENSTEVKYNRR